MIFNWMPVICTFMLGTFPAGLVIYWSWNNFLSILQQYFIMKRHGAEVDLFGNIMASFRRKPKPATDKPACCLSLRYEFGGAPSGAPFVLRWGTREPPH